MNKVKIFFCLFLFILSFFYLGNLLSDIDILSFILTDNKKEFVFDTITSNNLKSPLKSLEDTNQDEIVNNETTKRYSDFNEITPEILRAFVDKVIIHEKVKVDGHYVHTIEIIYNFVEAIDLPDFDAHLREEN